LAAFGLKGVRRDPKEIKETLFKKIIITKEGSKHQMASQLTLV